MQVYLPYPDLVKSAEVLDDRRLNRQRADILQVLKALSEPPPEDGNEAPLVKMWRGNEMHLVNYGIITCNEWVVRGNNDATMAKIMVMSATFAGRNDLPEWWGDQAFHDGHKSLLLRSKPSYYREKFGTEISDDLPLIFPRTPKKAKTSPEYNRAKKCKARYERSVRTMNNSWLEFLVACGDAGLNTNLEPFESEDDAEKFQQMLEQAIATVAPEDEEGDEDDEGDDD